MSGTGAKISMKGPVLSTLTGKSLRLVGRAGSRQADEKGSYAGRWSGATTRDVMLSTKPWPFQERRPRQTPGGSVAEPELKARAAVACGGEDGALRKLRWLAALAQPPKHRRYQPLSEPTDQRDRSPFQEIATRVQPSACRIAAHIGPLVSLPSGTLEWRGPIIPIRPARRKGCGQSSQGHFKVRIRLGSKVVRQACPEPAEELITNGKRTFVRPEPVEGLLCADFEKAPTPTTAGLLVGTYVL